MGRFLTIVALTVLGLVLSSSSIVGQGGEENVYFPLVVNQTQGLKESPSIPIQIAPGGRFALVPVQYVAGGGWGVVVMPLPFHGQATMNPLTIEQAARSGVVVINTTRGVSARWPMAWTGEDTLQISVPAFRHGDFSIAAETIILKFPEGLVLGRVEVLPECPPQC